MMLVAHTSQQLRFVRLARSRFITLAIDMTASVPCAVAGLSQGTGEGERGAGGR
jgi:hypothetical protein